MLAQLSQCHAVQMFDTIILLTGPTEQAALAPVLTRHNKTLTIKPIMTVDELRVVDGSLLRRSRLIAFVTTVIVPADILRAIGHGSFNFHPGPRTIRDGRLRISLSTRRPESSA